jgi:hypothetical protein
MFTLLRIESQMNFWTCYSYMALPDFGRTMGDRAERDDLANAVLTQAKPTRAPQHTGRFDRLGMRRIQSKHSTVASWWPQVTYRTCMTYFRAQLRHKVGKLHRAEIFVSLSVCCSRYPILEYFDYHFFDSFGSLSIARAWYRS